MVDYYEYIQSEIWFKRTESIRGRNGGLCEVCNMRYGNHVHHRTYKNLGNEKDEELLHVCSQCHQMIHRKGEDFIWPSKVKFLNQLREEVKDVS